MFKFKYCFQVKARNNIVYSCNVENHTKSPSSMDYAFMDAYSLAEAVSVIQLVQSGKQHITIRFAYRTSQGTKAYFYVEATSLPDYVILLKIYDWLELSQLTVIDNNIQDATQSYLLAHRYHTYPSFLDTVLSFRHKGGFAAYLCRVGHWFTSVYPTYQSDLRILQPSQNLFYDQVCTSKPGNPLPSQGRSSHPQYHLLDLKTPALDMRYEHEWNLSGII